MNPLFQLRRLGQSPWLDYLSRSLLASGGLQRLIDEYAVTGLTSNPSIFSKAITGSADYDDAIRVRVEGGLRDTKAIFQSLAVEDIRAAADLFRPIHQAAKGEDGYVSLEVSPDLAHDTKATIEEALYLFHRLNRPNALIKVPATMEGLPAIEELTAQGVNVNITLLFDTRVYEQVAEAYISGLERRRAAGHAVSSVFSVASFFVSRVDTAVDALLPESSPLRGKAAAANAKMAYQQYKRIFTGERWDSLAQSQAKPQRLLWGSTSTKNPQYSDVMYVDSLIGPNTINTMPENTLFAFADHGRAQATLDTEVREAERTLTMLRNAGVDFDSVLLKLLDDGLAAFAGDHHNLLAGLERKVEEVAAELGDSMRNLGPLRDDIRKRVEALQGNDTAGRIWAKDHTVWQDDPTEISDRLGWLDLPKSMRERLPDLEAFAEECAGFQRIVLLGMGGSSLTAEVMAGVFGGRPLTVLDSTHPESILAIEREGPLENALFIVASKSGSTIETISQFAYFYDKTKDGRQFVAITDPGSSLEALAHENGFRRVFLNPPDVGGRYSALSYFGLVPAALLGVDLHRLLDSAEDMSLSCASCVSGVDNPGVLLGAIMGESALKGRDKLTIILPDDLARLGDWLEQLIAESTGKNGKGIVPIAGEPAGPAQAYGSDRLFLSLGAEIDLSPSVSIPFGGKERLGAEFFRWEFATSVAGSILGIHPFDQPDVQQAKDATRRLLQSDRPLDLGIGHPGTVLDKVEPGDYIAILAYLPRTRDNIARLESLRRRLRDRYKAATTLGFGPRYLHSTGQLHKGGPANGVFLQIVDEFSQDAPIPGKPYTFGSLLEAQAAGDLEALRRSNGRAARVRLADLEREI